MTAGRTVSLLAGIVLVGAAAALWVPETMGAPDVCRPGYARSQRLPPDRYYPIAIEAYRRAGVPWSERHSHTLDHVRPLALGGGWQQSNLEVQTREDAAAKDRVEWQAIRAYCTGRITMPEALKMVEHWRDEP